MGEMINLIGIFLTIIGGILTIIVFLKGLSGRKKLGAICVFLLGLLVFIFCFYPEQNNNKKGNSNNTVITDGNNNSIVNGDNNITTINNNIIMKGNTISPQPEHINLPNQSNQIGVWLTYVSI